MRSKNKPVSRWVGETLLIFFSILGAFYVENYRERKSEERLYLKHLRDFQFSLESNLRSLTMELELIPGNVNQSDLWNVKIGVYDSLLMLMESGDSTQVTTIIELLTTKANYGIVKHIFPSPHHEKLSLDYYYFIKNPALKSSITSHKMDNQLRHEAKDDLDNMLKEFQLFQEELNLISPNDISNNRLIFSNQMLNKTRKIHDHYHQLKRLTAWNKTRDSTILVEINKELTLW